MMTDNFSSYKLKNKFISFPVVSIKENAPFGTQKTVSLDSMKSWLVRAASKTSKF